MARCGCGGGQCNCAVIAGDGVTIAGTGSPANPYIVGAEAPDCADVRGCLSGGPGITYTPGTGVIAARPSTDSENTLAVGTDGGLLVPPAAALECADVRPCLSAGDGLGYDEATGRFTADLSTDAGNNLALGGDGGLFVPTGAATVSTGCGLTGNGSAATPVRAQTATWPFPCPIDDNAGHVYCDANGNLRTGPGSKVNMLSYFTEQRYNNVAVPTAAQTKVATFETQFTNPDPCRESFVIAFREADVWFDLPPGSSAAAGFSGDEMWYQRNSGSSSNTGVHSQMLKALPNSPFTVGPGQSVTVGFDVHLGRGANNATYSLIQIIIRCLFMTM